ncbi:MAG: CRISPR-associated endonuclease Cas1 [Nitrospirota bacterium]
MERTLYLNESPGLRVRRDGPSLWIERRRTAGQRVPVRLIRRVLIAGNVALDTESLTAFAERGVPITLLNRAGEPVAVVLGCAAGLFARRGRQAAALEDPRQRDRLCAWLRAWERGRRLVLASRLDPVTAARWRREGMRPADYDTWIERQARLRGVSLRRRGFFRAALQTLALEAILEAGWDPHLGWLHRAQPLGFVRDCVAALQADADLAWLDSGAAAGDGIGALPRALAGHFESRRPRLATLLRRLLDQFAVMIWEP